MNTEHTNQPRQAANAAFEQWWQRHGLEDPMDDEDRYYITAISWARRGYLAAMQAQQAVPVAWVSTECLEWLKDRAKHLDCPIQFHARTLPLGNYSIPVYSQPPAVSALPDELTQEAREYLQARLHSELCKADAVYKTLRAMLAATPQAADPIKSLIAMHNELLGEYPYCYFELAYTRRTDWMAWLCTKPREDDPERKVLACGQGLTAEEACAEAVSAAQKGGAA